MKDTWDIGTEETKGYGLSLSVRVLDRVKAVIDLLKKGRLSNREAVLILKTLQTATFPFLAIEARDTLEAAIQELLSK